MTGDKGNFLTLKKERDGSTSFGNDNSIRIIGKGTVKLESKDATTNNMISVVMVIMQLIMMRQVHMTEFKDKGQVGRPILHLMSG
jgi:hypothetical protein